jgi:hypothetical protein
MVDAYINTKSRRSFEIISTKDLESRDTQNSARIIKLFSQTPIFKIDEIEGKDPNLIHSYFKARLMQIIFYSEFDNV